MTHDPFRAPPGTNPPRHVKETGNGPFIGGAIVVAILLAIGAWAVYDRSVRTAEQPPAATSTADETTGRAAPRLTQ